MVVITLAADEPLVEVNFLLHILDVLDRHSTSDQFRASYHCRGPGQVHTLRQHTEHINTDTGLPAAARATTSMVKPRDDPTLQHALSLFQDAFGSEPDIAAFAPGRVNLIGEHTDYNEGFVFPLALDLRTFVVGRGSLLVRPPNQKVPLTQCRVTSESHQGIVSFVADKGLAPGEPKWVNYVKGVVAEYLKDVPQGKYLVFEAAIASSVPLGSGLSSSASLEVSVATFLEQVLGTTPGKVQKALRCQSAEHKFAHVPCGIMDQFVSAMGRTGKVLLLDCQSQQETLVPLADPDLVILVTNSKVKHSLGSSEYPVRVTQCKAAVEGLRKKYPEIKSLRGASMEQLDSIRNDLPELVYKRARHVVTEDIRTLRCVKALKNKDYQAAGQAMVESHESLRDDYEVSCDELDFLVAEAMKVPGVLGSRMTGGGFGGCTVTLVRKQAAGLAAMNIKAAYRARFGVEAETFVTTPSTGASVVDLKKDEEGGRGGGRKGGRAGKVRYAMAGVAVLGVVVAIAMGLARRKV
ncbi:hypothetical protein VYU27_007786 [Nannochloropsis oceanica]